MDEILRHLVPGARVLDLGSLTGSFRADACPRALAVRLDLETPAAGSPEGFVQADAARLPFADHCFDAVIANHSLEHVENFREVLSEIGRVISADGSLYVAVPDASTFSDRLFRWVYRGGGHINPFKSSEELASQITKATGLKLSGSRPLYSSFEYLNRYYFKPGTDWRLLFAGNGNRQSIMLLSYLARLIDRVFGTRMSHYGWALYFGKLSEPVEPAPWSNVCVGCGSGFPAAWLVAAKLVRRRFLLCRFYWCPSCNSGNFFTPDARGGKGKAVAVFERP
ncbi:MAG TPA: class I SAM-dependent methyltransferase [Bryobacteraceae bacterium]|nr:class I SAM-dependent methyltransferase [Bryobacteraceae bacterium]